MDLSEFQQVIETMYSAKDRKRGSAGTFLWFMEEVGELAHAYLKMEQGIRGNADEHTANMKDAVFYILSKS